MFTDRESLAGVGLLNITSEVVAWEDEGLAYDGDNTERKRTVTWDVTKKKWEVGWEGGRGTGNIW